MAAMGTSPAVAWWVWPLALFVTCFLIGIVAVPAGIGGGTLFVPLIGGFFPFHLDFVRGAGLLVALASALAAAPVLLRSGLASLRLALPLALLASASSIGGALLGLALPAAAVQTALGLIVLGIVVLMLGSKKSEFPQVAQPDRLSAALQMNGVFIDGASGRQVDWQVHRTPLGLVLFLGIGVLAGMFGIGAGWANVPALNLLMGAPLKVSAGTSGLVLSLVDSSAAWVYLNRGAVLPMIAVPSVVGMMLGARIGARLLGVLKGSVIRKMVIALLLFAGVRALLKGLGCGRECARPRPQAGAGATARPGLYARLLDWGARIGLLALVFGFALYVLGGVHAAGAAGATARAVEPAGRPLPAANRHPHRLGLAGAGAQGRPAQPDGHRAAGRLFAAAAARFGRSVPEAARLGHAAICLLVVAVIVLAASGVLTAGH